MPSNQLAFDDSEGPTSGERHTVRDRAQQLAPRGGWFEVLLEHHGQIEAAIEDTAAGEALDERRRRQLQLQSLWSAHSGAESLILYPALAIIDKRRAYDACIEHLCVDVCLAEMRLLTPRDLMYQYRFDAMRLLILDHMYHEECSWLPAMQLRTIGTVERRLAEEYRSEFNLQRIEGTATLGGTAF
jgi:hypothetical protein